MKMSLRAAMCQALVDGWHGGWNMGRVVGYAWALTEETPENETHKYLAAAEAEKVRRIFANDRAQVWIARYMHDLNEALWAGRKRDTCLGLARKALGLRVVGKDVVVGVRERDKSFDWKTVK